MLRYSLRIECHRNSCKYLDSYKFCGNPSLKFACFRDYKQNIPPPEPDSIPDSSSPDSSSPEAGSIPDESSPEAGSIPDESSPEADSIPDESSPEAGSIPEKLNKIKLTVIVNHQFIKAMIKNCLSY